MTDIIKYSSHTHHTVKIYRVTQTETRLVKDKIMYFL